MLLKFRTSLLVCLLTLGLAACSDESSISSSSGGTSAGDGGAQSAQYAGTYKGSMAVEYHGDGVDGTDTLPATVIIHNNGTVTLEMEGESVNGTINANQLEIAFDITKNQDGIKCDGTALVQATVSGTSLNGPVKGNAECSLTLIKRTASLTGTLSAQKI